MRLAVIGAGPAGLTCVKQALADGHDVVCYEKHQDLGGIWNPASGGAYAGVRMQSSRMSMPFSDHPPGFTADFPTQAEVQTYLHDYATGFGLLDVVRFGREVVAVTKEGDQWRVTTRASGGPIWSGGGGVEAGGPGGDAPGAGGPGADAAGAGVLGGHAPNPGGPSAHAPGAGERGGGVPEVGGPGGDAPNLGGRGADAPNPGGLGGHTPDAGGPGADAPNPEGLGRHAPGAGGRSGGVPKAEGPGGHTPNLGGRGGDAPSPEGPDGHTAGAGGLGGHAPNPGGPGVCTPGAGERGSDAPDPERPGGPSPDLAGPANPDNTADPDNTAHHTAPGASLPSTFPVPVNPDHSELYDAVLVANGELWRPRLPGGGLPAPGAGVRVLTSPEYRGPETFTGKRVLVVGGGVSGADIAADLAPHAERVDWSVRRRQLFLPRDIGGVYNDALFSYAGRVAVEDIPYDQYLSWLTEWIPEYMARYEATGLLPRDGYHGAVHVNEKIVPAVYDGGVTPVAAFGRFTEDGDVVLTDDTRKRYDAVILCLGYEAPDYSFLPALRREDLYEHHFWRHDPTLTVVNTPVDTEAFGTACPYFEAIGGWVLSVLGGKTTLPGPEERAAWCATHMGALTDRRYLDCWLETIRLGLLSGALPDPAVRFRAYWTLVSSQVDPANLRPGEASSIPAAHDDRFDLAAVRHRILAALPQATRERLLADGEIDAADLAAAAEVPEGRALPPWLPYRQRESAAESAA